MPDQPFSLHTQLVLLKVFFLVIVILFIVAKPTILIFELACAADVPKNAEVAGATKCTSRNLSLLFCVD